MKKLIFSQVVVSEVTLAIFYLTWTISGQVNAATLATAVAIFLAMLFSLTISVIVAASTAAIALTVFTGVFATPNVIGIIIFTIFTVVLAGASAEKLQPKREQIVGACLAQAAVLYGIMASIVDGFGVSRVVIPTVSAFTLAGALFVPTVILAIERRRLLREKMELERNVSVLEEQRTQYVIPIGLARSKKNLAAVNERLK